jgi:hypothetical protein
MNLRVDFIHVLNVVINGVRINRKKNHIYLKYRHYYICLSHIFFRNYPYNIFIGEEIEYV